MEQVSTRIPAPLRRRISDRAHRTGKPQSEVVREALERGMSELDPRPYGLDELARINAHGGPADLAMRHDDYLYGEDA